MCVCNKILTLISFFCENLDERFQQAKFISKEFGMARFFEEPNL